MIPGATLINPQNFAEPLPAMVFDGARRGSVLLFAS